MATIRSYRKKWLKYHSQYEKKAFRIFQKAFKEMAKGVDYDSMTEQNYKELIQGINSKMLFIAYEDVYLDIGLVHGKRIGKEFITGLKFFSLLDFESSYIDMILDWLYNDGANRIRAVYSSFTNDIITIIGDAMKEGEGIDKISRRIEKSINSKNFYRWQAERIARTESTGAANFAALESGRTAGVKMQKLWISSQDSRTRRIPEDKFDHFDMNGTILKDLDAYFEIEGYNKGVVFAEGLKYPGDPRGSAGNVINCRCTLALTPQRDDDGNLILNM